MRNVDARLNSKSQYDYEKTTRTNGRYPFARKKTHIYGGGDRCDHCANDSIIWQELDVEFQGRNSEA